MMAIIDGHLDLGSLPRLNLPPARLRVKRCEDGVVRIHDRLRDKFVALTPEEWVRQNFVEYLTGHLGYPPALMANEVSLRFNHTRRRCDTVLFSSSPDLRPLVIIEYKAPSVEITQRVFDQIARYNLVMGARVLAVTNGIRHFCCRLDTAAPQLSYRFLNEIPSYDCLLKLQ